MSDDKTYQKLEVLVKFMSPGSELAGDTYDEDGNKIKPAYEAFTKKEIEELKKKGIEKLYYVKELPTTSSADGSVSNSPYTTVTDEERAERLKTQEAIVTSSSVDDDKITTDQSVFLCNIEQRARTLLCNFNVGLREFFIPRFIANGIALYKAENLEQASSALELYRITHLLLDLDSEGEKWIDFIEYSKKNSNYEFHLFVFYGQKSKELLKRLLEQSIVTSALDNTIEKKELAKVMIDNINIHDSYLSMRTHLKVLLSEKDNLKVDIYLSESQIISGLAYFISPLEIEVSLATDIKGELYNFSVGDTLSRIGLNLGGKISFTQAEVQTVDMDLAKLKLKFSQRSESLMNGIGKIMMEKLRKIKFVS